MKKRSISRTAIPHVFFAAILLGGIVYAERYLLSRTERPTLIPITVSADEELEKEITQQFSVREEGLPENIKILLAGTNVAENLLKSPYAEGLSEADRLGLYASAAMRLYEADNFAEAVKVLAVLDLPARLENDVQFIYAYSLAKRSLPDQAIEQYRALIRQTPNHQAGNLNLGLLLRQGGQCDLAIPVFAHAVAISSGVKKAKAYSAQASCYLDMDQPQQAEQLYKKSIEYRPSSHSTWRQLAKTYAVMGRNKEAQDAFDKSIALNPNDYKAYIDKAEFQLEMYEINGAKRTMLSAKKLAKEPRIIELLAWSYLEDGARNSARAQLRYLIDNSSSSTQMERANFLLMYIEEDYEDLLMRLGEVQELTADMRYLQGLAHRKTGHFKSALKVFDDLSAVREYQFRAEIQRTRIARSRRQYADAAARYDALLAQSPSANALWFESALVAERQANFESGLEKINRALAIEADNQVYILIKARLLTRLNRTPQAVDLLQTLLAEQPKNTRALKMLAAIYQRVGNYDDLADVYNRLMEIEPDDIETEFRYARVQVKLKNFVPAQATLRNIIEQKPDHIQARHLLATLLFDLGQLDDASIMVDQILQLAHDDVAAKKLKQQIADRKSKEQ